MLAGLTARYGLARLKPGCDPFGVSGRIKAYLAGDFGALDDTSVEPGGTPFQRDVWTALRRVPAGDRNLRAARSDRRAACRVARGWRRERQEPGFIVIPCHRMIGSDGSLTGYGGGWTGSAGCSGTRARFRATDAQGCAGAWRPSTPAPFKRPPASAVILIRPTD